MLHTTGHHFTLSIISSAALAGLCCLFPVQSATTCMTARTKPLTVFLRPDCNGSDVSVSDESAFSAPDALPDRTSILILDSAPENSDPDSLYSDSSDSLPDAYPDSRHDTLSADADPVSDGSAISADAVSPDPEPEDTHDENRHTDIPDASGSSGAGASVPGIVIIDPADDAASYPSKDCEDTSGTTYEYVSGSIPIADPGSTLPEAALEDAPEESSLSDSPLSVSSPSSGSSSDSLSTGDESCSFSSSLDETVPYEETLDAVPVSDAVSAGAADASRSYEELQSDILMPDSPAADLPAADFPYDADEDDLQSGR